MRSSTYWGDSTALVRPPKTRTGVCIGQKEDDGECAALCGTCFHLLHSKGFQDWYCSDPECGKVYSLADEPNSSIFPAYRFSENAGASKFVAWLEVWTGLSSAEFTVKIEFEE